MLTKEPKSRATLTDVAKHAWFVERVEQPIELKKIRITPADVESAIGVAKWYNPKLVEAGEAGAAGAAVVSL